MEGCFHKTNGNLLEKKMLFYGILDSYYDNRTNKMISLDGAILI